MTDKAIEAAIEAAEASADYTVSGEFVTVSGISEMVRAAIATYEAALWQPIETAPKNGTEIIVADSLGVDVAAFDGIVPLEEFLLFCGDGETADDYPAYVAEREMEMQGWMRHEAITGDVEYIASPTHWRPLPHPPQEPGQ